MSSEDFDSTGNLDDNGLSSQLSQLLILTDSLEIFCAIHEIYAFSHVHISQWKDLNLASNLIEDLIGMVCRFEGSYQFKGLGIWLLDMLLESGCELSCLQALGSISTLNALLRISLEHNAQDKCFRYFLKCIDMKLTTFGQLFDMGNSIKVLTHFASTLIFVMSFMQLLIYLISYRCLSSMEISWIFSSSQ